MRIKWLRRALLDLEEVEKFVSMDSPANAVAVVVKLITAVSLLGDQQGIGRPGRVPGTRELVISGLPYIVPYRVKDGAVEILRIYHAARKWPRHF